jgi:hypothetical protein
MVSTGRAARPMAPKCKKPPGLQGDSSNVEVALRCFPQCYTQVFLSDYKSLLSNGFLVAGARTYRERTEFRMAV